MLLKRSFVLAAGILLFIVAYIVYFDLARSDMENHFRAEREKFNVQGAVLTSSEPPGLAATSTPSSSDSNAVISPVPPPAASDSTTAPDTNAAPTSMDTNAAPSTDSNAAPAAPVSPSTMIYPRAGHSPFLVLTSYRPSEHAMIQMAGPVETQTSTASPAPEPPVAAPAAPATPVAAPARPAKADSASSEGSVIVLLFHQFKAAGVPIPAKFQWTMNVDVFESEMKYIHDNGYTVISMAQLLKFLKHQGTVPPRAVVVTIDDGYKSAIVYAAPVLKKYGYPWTFFVYPEFITTAEGPGAASWNDLLQLQSEGIDIESHSMTHPTMTKHTQKFNGHIQPLTPEQYDQFLTTETSGAKAILEQKMGKPITCFAYPFGAYNKQVEAKVIAAGYEAIFTVADNPVHSSTSLDSIGRYTITQGVEKNFAAYLRQGALGLSAVDPAPGATITEPRPVITATLGYPGALDPKSIETSVRDFGVVRHDFDPQTNTVRLYLPRDLVSTPVLVNIRVKDAASGQIMVANWHFNYEPDTTTPANIHQPIAPAAAAPMVASPATPAPAPTPVAPATSPVTAVAPKVTASAATNAPATSEPEPMEKSAVGSPLDAHPVPPTPPAPSQNPITTHD